MSTTKILTIFGVDQEKMAFALDADANIYEQSLNGMFHPADYIPSADEIKEIFIERVLVQRNPLYEEGEGKVYEIQYELDEQ